MIQDDASRSLSNERKEAPKVPGSCKLCNRAGSEGPYCKYHSKAQEAIRAGFEKWKTAYDGLTWDSYLERLSKNPETGRWVREVAEDLLKEKSQA